jgi:hypothetical protein
MFDEKSQFLHDRNTAIILLRQLGSGGAWGGGGGGVQTRTFLFVNYQLLGVNQRAVGFADESCYFVNAILSIYTIKINMILKPVIKQNSLVPIKGTVQRDGSGRN